MNITEEPRPTLESLRLEIDAADQIIIEALAQRLKAVEMVGVVKAEQGLPPLDSARWQHVLQTRMDAALARGIDPELIRQIYELIHDYALDIESQNQSSDSPNQ